jgi:hypothetical protein
MPGGAGGRVPGAIGIGVSGSTSACCGGCFVIANYFGRKGVAKRDKKGVSVCPFNQYSKGRVLGLILRVRDKDDSNGYVGRRERG